MTRNCSFASIRDSADQLAGSPDVNEAKQIQLLASERGEQWVPLRSAFAGRKVNS